MKGGGGGRWDGVVGGRWEGVVGVEGVGGSGGEVVKGSAINSSFDFFSLSTQVMPLLLLGPRILTSRGIPLLSTPCVLLKRVHAS